MAHISPRTGMEKTVLAGAWRHCVVQWPHSPRGRLRTSGFSPPPEMHAARSGLPSQLASYRDVPVQRGEKRELVRPHCRQEWCRFRTMKDDSPFSGRETLLKTSKTFLRTKNRHTKNTRVRNCRKCGGILARKKMPASGPEWNFPSALEPQHHW